MNYTLNAGNFGSVFAVPNSVVDNFIKLANEASVKVLLYMLRNNDREHSSESLASALNISANQVEEAFVFWENANIFSKSEPVNTPPAQPTSTQVSPQKIVQKPDRRSYNISPSEIAERIESSEDVKNLFLMAEQTFGRPLNHTEHRSFIWMHDNLGLSTEVILMITAYCVSIQKTGIDYMSTIAEDWAKREINTLELAQDEIKCLEEKATFDGNIRRIFELNRKPTPKQQQMVESWKEKGYSLELIEYAYEKCIEQINKLSFPYINKILENWYSQGLITRSQVDSESNLRSEKKEYSFELDEYKELANNFGE